jgi:hypothetical protein
MHCKNACYDIQHGILHCTLYLTDMLYNATLYCTIEITGAALVGTDFLLNLMTAPEAYDVMRTRGSSMRPLGINSLSGTKSH